MPLQYAYLIGCLLYGLIWFAIFLLRKDLRKELILITLFCAPLGFTEWLYHDYWQPLFLFPLLPRIGLEDFIYAGIVSGVSAVIYEIVAQRRTYKQRRLHPGWMGTIWLSSIFVGGTIILFVATTWLHINSVYVSVMGFGVVGSMIVWRRPDLLRDALISGLLMALTTFIVEEIWLLFYPNAFQIFWELHNVSNLLFLRVPIEEIWYSFAWGTAIGPMYELIAGLRLRKR